MSTDPCYIPFMSTEEVTRKARINSNAAGYASGRSDWIDWSFVAQKPECQNNGLYLVEDSIFGLCSNFCLYCKNCPFSKGFASSKKQQRNSEINIKFACALRIVGKGFTAAKKLCATLNLTAFLSKVSFRIQELKLLYASASVAENSIKHAAEEIRNADDPLLSA
ncbi:hypothetical protein AVEN_57923-1 [Araneus ventricosus]|uniref:Mutator-like transposase domain-containing protein n=1 Tax=Araneus ventricosus TaxID=182803 RepID=A0A4Y2KHH1_ARAVE|nr:hypothetical protein AVEN_57923-1 [Araneus ventricosus]